MSALALLRGIFDVDDLNKRLVEIEEKLKEENIWSNQELSSKLLKEQKEIKSKLENLSSWKNILDDSIVAIELEDVALILETKDNLKKLQQDFDKFDLENMLNGEYDKCDAIFTVNSGAGGVDAQDWADMLFRMYLRWAQLKGYTAEILDKSDGEEAGIKSATVKVSGLYAYGYLKAEKECIGLLEFHRLMRTEKDRQVLLL